MAKLPSYLLKAPGEDMQRWRAAAAARGQSLASYTRDALDEHADAPVRPRTVPGMVWLSVECHRGDHRGCDRAECQCGCH